MNRIRREPLLFLTLLASHLLLATSASALTQYSYPPPGSPAFVGAGTGPGDAGGLTWSFSAWNSAEYVELYVGAGFHAAGLDGTAHDLTFAGISGQQVTYTGTSAWTSPGGTVPAGGYVVPITMTVTLSGYGATWLAAGSARWCNTSLRSASVDASQSSSACSGWTVGSVLRPHCSQALIATCRQCWIFLSARSPASLTPVRSVNSGAIACTPSSVDFCTIQSMRSPRERAMPRWICRGDSRSTSRRVPVFTCTRFLSIATISPGYSPPLPSNRINGSPTQSQYTAQVAAGFLHPAETMYPPGVFAGVYIRGARMAAAPGLKSHAGKEFARGFNLVHGVEVNAGRAAVEQGLAEL